MARLAGGPSWPLVLGASIILHRGGRMEGADDGVLLNSKSMVGSSGTSAGAGLGAAGVGFGDKTGGGAADLDESFPIAWHFDTSTTKHIH